MVFLFLAGPFYHALLPTFYRDFLGAEVPHEREAIIKTLDENLTAFEKQNVCFGYKVPSWRELNELKKTVDLERKYPSQIKGMFGPGPDANTAAIMYFGDELKDVGVNTYYVVGEYWLKNGKIEPFYPLCREIMGRKFVYAHWLSEEEIDRVLIQRILLAKQAGFAVILIPDYAQLFYIGRENCNIDLVAPQLEKVVLKYAKLAEKYGVEYLVPVNEYNFELYSNGYSFEEIADRTNAFTKKIVPEVRKLYSGKIIQKVGMTGDKSITDTTEKYANIMDLEANGIDLWAIDCGLGNTQESPGSDIVYECKAATKYGGELSKRDNIPWIIGEFLVYSQKDRIDIINNNIFRLGGQTPSNTPQEEYYRQYLNSFKAEAINPSGFTFVSWLAGGKIRGTPAARLMKDFFQWLGQ